MRLKSKILGLVLVSAISIGVSGCNNTGGNNSQTQDTATDEAFISDFQKSINKRWDEQDKLEKKVTSNANYTDDQYKEDTTKVLEEEINNIKKNLDGVKDKDLKKLGIDYIEGVKKQIEAGNTEDYELMDKYIQESEKLRKPALISMVDDYGVKIDEDHKQTYKDFKEQATVINKENEAKSYADKLATEITLERTTDEFGYVEFSGIVENKSKIDFKSLSYKVQYKDKEGIVVGDDIIYLENFAPGSKQKVNLMPMDESAEKVVITTDWFESK